MLFLLCGCNLEGNVDSNVDFGPNRGHDTSSYRDTSMSKLLTYSTEDHDAQLDR